MKKIGRYNVYGFEKLVNFYKENLDFEGDLTMEDYKSAIDDMVCRSSALPYKNDGARYIYHSDYELGPFKTKSGRPELIRFEYECLYLKEVDGVLRYCTEEDIDDCEYDEVQITVWF